MDLILIDLDLKRYVFNNYIFRLKNINLYIYN